MHASAPRWVIFFIWLMIFNKPPISIAEQIHLLTRRGLVITGKSEAHFCLANISYFRLLQYTHPFQENESDGRPFKAGTTFNQVLDLYMFDRKLRFLVFDAIERIEVALRTQIIYEFTMAYGSHWFENPSLFKSSKLLERDLRSLDKELKRSSEAFIQNYKKKYSNPRRPAAWLSLEISTMGLLSKIFENLKNCRAKKNIANHFGIGHPKVLESWAHSFSNTRNICAHHGRLWNRHFTQAPTLAKNLKRDFLKNHQINPHLLYTTLSCMVFVLKIISPDNLWLKTVKSFLQKCQGIPFIKMGFPDNWHEEPIWKF